MSDTNVIPLRPRQDAPVQPLPRSPFGLREAVLRGGMDIGPAGKAGMEAARDADREVQLKFKRAAREAREAYKTNLQAVDAETRAEWATRIREAVRALEAVQAEVHRAEVIPSSVSLREHCGLLEAEAARLDPVCDLPEGA